MSNRIDAMFGRKRSEGRRATIFYVTAGFPDEPTTERVVAALREAGADLIELGIPFSDPIADGPTIQKASASALANGMTTRKALDLAARLRAASEIPILLFSAFNPILHFGLEAFVNAAAKAGVDGLLVPDLPPEEAGDLRGLCLGRGLTLTFLVAPTTDAKRRELIASQSSGFIYYISLRGVTGARESLPEDLMANLDALRAATELPIAVGFGVSKPEHARQIGEKADGIVVGSALINEIAAGTDPTLETRVKTLARGLIEALPVGSAIGAA